VGKKLVLPFVMVIGSALALISGPHIFMNFEFIPGYEFIYAMGLVVAAVLVFVGVRTIIFEVRWKKSLDRQ